MSRAKSDNLYLSSGYLDVRGLADSPAPFTFVVAARGTGKTYGACEYVLSREERGEGKFIFMRRTNTQAEIIRAKEFSPFAALPVPTVNKPLNKYITAVYRTDEDGEASGAPAGYICGLSTFANVRGFDASEITTIVYDEFIPEPQEKAFCKDEAGALWNAFETVNRNRELNGQRPVKMLCLANSNKLDNDYFVSFELVGKAWDMVRKGREYKILRDRGISICIPQNSPISERKAETALYKAVPAGAFRDMALNNVFGFDDTNISPRRLNEYRPVVSVGEVCVYEHKARYEYYVSRHSSGRVRRYDASAEELERFRYANMWLWRCALSGDVYYEDAACKALFDRYFK